MRETNVSHAGDPVHAGDKTLTRETTAQRGRVNRYDRGPSIDASYHVSVHLAMRCQRRRFLKIGQTTDAK